MTALVVWVLVVYGQVDSLGFRRIEVDSLGVFATEALCDDAVSQGLPEGWLYMCRAFVVANADIKG
jgi:hypothetical protein